MEGVPVRTYTSILVSGIVPSRYGLPHGAGMGSGPSSGLGSSTGGSGSRNRGSSPVLTGPARGYFGGVGSRGATRGGGGTLGAGVTLGVPFPGPGSA